MTDQAVLHQVESDSRRYLNTLDLEILQRRIRRYLRNNRSEWDFQQRLDAFFDVFSRPDKEAWNHFPSTFPVPAETTLYRARKIQSIDQIRSIKDVVAPDRSRINPGRLNRKGQPLLYTAFDPATAAHEVRAELGDIVSMAQFESRSPISAVDLRAGIFGQHTSSPYRQKAKLLGDFVERLISQRDAEFPDYAETEFVIDTLFNLPTNEAWFYPSYATPTGRGENLCLRSDVSIFKLRLNNVEIHRLVGIGNEGFMSENLATLYPDEKWNLHRAET